MGKLAFEKALRATGAANYWPLAQDQLGVAVDVLGGTGPGSYTGSPPRDGIPGPFPGVGVSGLISNQSQRIEFNTTFDDASWTWLVWYYATTYGTDGTILLTSQSGAADDYVFYYLSTSSMYVNRGFGSSGPSTPGIPPSADRWQMHVVTADGTSGAPQVYLDGRFSVGANGSAAAGMTVRGTNYYSGGSYAQYRPYGYIGPIARWSRPISPTEIAYLWDQAKRPDRIPARRRLRAA